MKIHISAFMLLLYLLTKCKISMWLAVTGKLQNIYISLEKCQPPLMKPTTFSFLILTFIKHVTYSRDQAVLSCLIFKKKKVTDQSKESCSMHALLVVEINNT
jgi:hypothetical protein